MELGFVIWSGPDFGGMERRYTGLAAHMSLACPSIHVTILAQRRCAEKVRRLLGENSNVNLICYGDDNYDGALGDVAKEIFDLVKKIKKTDLDHLHICANLGFFTTLAAIFSPWRIKMSAAMVDSTYSAMSSRMQRLIARMGLFRYAKIDCLSDAVCENTLHYYPALKGRCKVAPCSFIDYSKSRTLSYRDIDVACVARFVSGKGYELLERSSDSLSNLSMHICGFGKFRPRLCGENIKIYKTDDSFSVLARSKIFLSLQKNNNYPSQSLLEAMASGCAIIATDVGETRKLLDDSCAILIPYDEGALIDAIMSLLDDESKIKKIGTNARRRAIDGFSVERYCKYFISDIIV